MCMCSTTYSEMRDFNVTSDICMWAPVCIMLLLVVAECSLLMREKLPVHVTKSQRNSLFLFVCCTNMRVYTCECVALS